MHFNTANYRSEGAYHQFYSPFKLLSNVDFYLLCRFVCLHFHIFVYTAYFGVPKWDLGSVRWFKAGTQKHLNIFTSHWNASSSQKHREAKQLFCQSLQPRQRDRDFNTSVIHNWVVSAPLTTLTIQMFLIAAIICLTQWDAQPEH